MLYFPFFSCILLYFSLLWPFLWLDFNGNENDHKRKQKKSRSKIEYWHPFFPHCLSLGMETKRNHWRFPKVFIYAPFYWHLVMDSGKLWVIWLGSSKIQVNTFVSKRDDEKVRGWVDLFNHLHWEEEKVEGRNRITVRSVNTKENSRLALSTENLSYSISCRWWSDNLTKTPTTEIALSFVDNIRNFFLDFIELRIWYWTRNDIQDSEELHRIQRLTSGLDIKRMIRNKWN